MKTTSYTILVTGVGAIIGYGIIKSLRKSGHDLIIIGMDIYADAAGRHWCDHFEQAARAEDAKYVSFLCSLIEKHKIDLVIPGIEQDVSRMSRERKHLQSLPSQFALNTPELISISNDKWLMQLKLAEAGLPRIKSYIEGPFEEISQEIGLPMVLKPRRSYASKGIYLIHSAEDFAYWKRRLGDNFMVQELVGSDQDEYTAAVFAYGNGDCSKNITFKRTLSGEGATAKAMVVDEPDLSGSIDTLVEIFQPEGPTNFQYRRHKGHFLLLEINPRISASTSLRTAFGFNEAQMCIEYYLDKKRPNIGTIREGRAVRYIEDYVIYDSNDL
jgi:carbamoyl-phosphate synthase large subunit